MLVTLNQGSVDIRVDFESALELRIEPGVWQVDCRGRRMSVTSLRGRVIAGHLYLAYPKGVALKSDGRWSAQERILVGLLPEKLLLAWACIPEAIRDALNDAYLLARHDIPEQLGAP